VEEEAVEETMTVVDMPPGRVTTRKVRDVPLHRHNSNSNKIITMPPPTAMMCRFDGVIFPL
jgi:hypothetical protein